MMAPDIFLGLIKKASGDHQGQTFKLGTIPGTYAAGRPTVTFDGEDTESTKTYPHLSSYAPAAGDRVLMALVGHTWVILGDVV